MKIEWREVASNLGFTEGPIAVSDGVIFASINRGKLFHADFNGSIREFSETGGGPNGLAEGRDGEIYVAQNGGQIVPTKSALQCSPSIQAVAADGSVRLVSDDYNAPNDCAFGPDGRLYFTDPHGSTKAAKPGPGRVWALDTKTGERELILEGARHPNGLAFGPDGSTLYIAETLRNRIMQLKRTAEGWREDGVFAYLPEGEPDGLAFDTEGRLWCAASQGDVVIVFEPNGKPAHILPLGPSFPTNLCFGGPDRATLYVTAPKGGRLIAADLDTQGIALL